MTANINAEWTPNQAAAEPTDQELHQAAHAKGFTREVTAEGGEYTLFLLIQPDADLDGCFKAWDCADCEWLKVNGWLFTFEEGH